MSQQINKLGLHLSVVSTRFGSLGELSREAEERGYASIWVAEVAGPNAFVALAPCAMATKRVDLATGIVPIQIRTPGVIAMGRSGAERTFGRPRDCRPWRVQPGDRRALARRVHIAKPVTAMRECVTIMRQLFTEGRGKFEGKVYRSDFRPRLPVEISGRRESISPP